jgi:hypothetical protein
MTRSITTNAPHVIDEVLDTQRQQSLDEQCNKVVGLLGSAFLNKVEAVRALEAIRWTGEWTYDQLWNDLKTGNMQGMTQAQCDAVPKDWYTWLEHVREFRIEGEPIAQKTYSQLRGAGVLIDAINYANTERMLGDAGELPLPANQWHVAPFVGLLAKEDPARGRPLAERFAGFAPAFRQRIEAAAVGDFAATPFLPAAEQTQVVLAWHSVWDALPADRKFHTGGSQKGAPKPPSEKFSREVLKSTQEDANSGGGIKVPTGRTEVLDQVAKQKKAEEQEAARKAHRALMDKVREARSSQNAINEQERVRRELRMKEEQALDEIKGNVRDYNSMLNSVLVEMDKLLRFLTKISNIKGTVYLEELRQMDMGIVSVADDVQRYRKMQDRLGEIFKLASSSNPPAGIDMSTFTVDADAQEDLF